MNTSSWSRLLPLGGILFILTACQPEFATQTPTNYPSGVFVIDTASDLGQISPYVLGTNHGPWADLGVNNLEPVKNSGITFLRWPGGNWGDRNDITTLQADNYIAQAKMIGAEPSITLRLPGSTPEAAAEWVRYMNIERTLRWGTRRWTPWSIPSVGGNSPRR